MRFLCLLIFLFISISCHKNICGKEEVKNSSICGDGIILYAGHPAVDGLGWVIKFENEKIEKPSNLADNFKTDGLKVAVCYEKTAEKFPCFCANGGMEMIKIVSISKR